MDALLALRHTAAGLRLRRPRITSGQRRAAHSVPTRGRGMDYAESRVYEPGDEVRHIDWRVTARTTRLHTKLYVEERERPVLLLVDMGVNMQFGTRRAFKSVAAAELAALLAWTSVRNGDRVGAVISDGHDHVEVEPRAGPRGALRVLHALVDADVTAKRRLDTKVAAPGSRERRPPAALDLLLRARRAARPGTAVHMLSDLRAPLEELEPEARRIALHCDASLWLCYDMLEAQAPPPGRYVVGDGYRAGIFDTHSKLTRAHHEAQFERHRQACESLCRRYGIRFSAVSSEQLPETLLAPRSTHDSPPASAILSINEGSAHG